MESDNLSGIYKFYLTFIHIKKCKININKIRNKIEILSFYMESSFLFYFGINKNIFYYLI